METTLKIENLCYGYDDKQVLNSISLEAHSGSIVAILGPNGAGKSTLFRLIAGLLFPRSGSLNLFGVDCHKLYKNRPFTSGVCIDGAEPSSKEKVKNIVALESGVIKLDRKEFLGDMAANNISANQRYGQLSKGQKRYLLSRLTLTGKRDLILLDEPGDGLDLQKRRELYDRIRDYATTHNATVIIATHILSDVERIADDVVILNAGEITIHGDLEDIRDNYRLIRCYESQSKLPENIEIIHTANSDDEQTILAKADYQTWNDFTLPNDCELENITLENLYLTLTGKQGVDENE